MRQQIEEIRVIYSQDADCCSDGEPQTIEVFTQDGGAGKYFVIKTDRWAFDRIDELIELLNNFKQKAEWTQ